MPPSPESMKIAGAFHKYTQSGDKSLIKDIPEDALELAFLQYARDKGTSHYMAMEMRLNELKTAKINVLEKSKVSYLCGPLAKSKCDMRGQIEAGYADNNIFLDIPYVNYEDCEKALIDLMKEIGLNPVLAKGKVTSAGMLCKICSMIQTCKYGITDISSASNSVAYEYGLMHGYGMKVCLLLRQRGARFSDIEGIEHLSYSGMRTFKIAMSKWILDNVTEIDINIVKKIIEFEEAELESKGDIDLKKIDTPLLTEEERAMAIEFKESQFLEGVDKRLNALAKAKGLPSRNLCAIPVSNKKELIETKQLLANKGSYILGDDVKGVFPCMPHELTNGKGSFIIDEKFQMPGRLKYFEVNTSGIIFYKENLYEQGKDDWGEDKEKKTVIDDYLVILRLYQFLLLARKIYAALNYHGDINILYLLENVKGLKFLHLDPGLMLSHALGKVSHDEEIKVSRIISVEQLNSPEIDEVVLEIFEEIKASCAVQDPYNRKDTLGQLENVKIALYGKDICSCTKFYKPMNRDKCLQCMAQGH